VLTASLQTDRRWVWSSQPASEAEERGGEEAKYPGLADLWWWRWGEDDGEVAGVEERVIVVDLEVDEKGDDGTEV